MIGLVNPPTMPFASSALASVSPSSPSYSTSSKVKRIDRERWFHTAGCRRWFYAVRDTATHGFLGTYRIGEAPPA